MQTHQTQSQQAKTDAVPTSTPPVTQPTSPSPIIEPKSNAEGLAEHAERLEKFQRLDTSMVQMGPPRLTNGNPIQPKLTIGAPGDKYEQEADRVAKQVVTQMHSPKGLNPPSSAQRQDLPEQDELMMKPNIQRHNGPKDATPNLEQAINQSRGGGRPLDDKIRGPMEQAFGANFGGVRVHSDRKAHQLNESIQARAFTTGQDLFFRQGAYQPGNRAGQELLAHELTHVIQQNGKSIQPSPYPQSNRAGLQQKKEPTPPPKSMELCWKSNDVFLRRQSEKQNHVSQAKNNVIPYITDKRIHQTLSTNGRLQKTEHLSQQVPAQPQYALVEKRQPKSTVMDSISPNSSPSIQRELADSWNQDEELYKLKDQVSGLQWYFNPETQKFYYLVEGQAANTETAQSNNMSLQDLHAFWVGYSLGERSAAEWQEEAIKDETGLLDSRIPWQCFMDAVGEDLGQENADAGGEEGASTILSKIMGKFKDPKPNAKTNKWRLGAEGVGHLAGGAIILALTVPAIGSGAGALFGVPAAIGGGVQILIGLSKLGRAWLTHKKGKENDEQTAQKYGKWLNDLIVLEGVLSLAFNTFMAIATGGAVVSILGASGGLLKSVRGITLRATDFGNKHPKFIALMTGIEGILTCIGRVLGIVIEGSAAIAKNAVLMAVAAIKESRAGANWRKAKEAAEAQ